MKNIETNHRSNSAFWRACRLQPHDSLRKGRVESMKFDSRRSQQLLRPAKSQLCHKKGKERPASRHLASVIRCQGGPQRKKPSNGGIGSLPGPSGPATFLQSGTKNGRCWELLQSSTPGAIRRVKSETGVVSNEWATWVTLIGKIPPRLHSHLVNE